MGRSVLFGGVFWVVDRGLGLIEYPKRVPSLLESQHHNTTTSLSPLQNTRRMSTPIPSAGSTHQRPSSSTRRPRSRPTTPLRPSSRSSLRESSKKSKPLHASSSSEETPLEAYEPEFAELGDSMADLEANLMHLQIMHESLARFSENFGAFLYGLNMNAFCVDFGEVSSFQLGEGRREWGKEGRGLIWVIHRHRLRIPSGGRGRARRDWVCYLSRTANHHTI
jgi:DASH complex subunit DAM1